MDEASLALLKAELESRLGDVERIARRIEARSGSFRASQEGVDSMAYQLHNLYGACEQLFEEVARAFENQVDMARYHTDLLRRMRLEIEGIRPALLSAETAEALDELRRFRHLFRHAYTMDLDAERVAALAALVPAAREAVAADLVCFLQQLRPA